MMKKEKNIDAINQSSQNLFPIGNIVADNRPTVYEYALLSQQVYGGSTLKEGTKVPGMQWKIKAIKAGKSNYFGVIYFNTTTQQVVVAHRGTDSLGALLEDMKGIYFNHLSPQKENIFAFIKQAIDFSQEMEFQLSFTGHSLGAFLAELSVYYCHRSHNYPGVNAALLNSSKIVQDVYSSQCFLNG